MAGQIAEIARDLRPDFRSLDPGTARVLLIEASDRVLGAFPPEHSVKAERSLVRLGVTTLLDHTVADLDTGSVTVIDANDVSRQIPARTVVWAAGVTASSLAGVLAERAGVEVDRAGRVEVLEDLSLPGHPNVLAIGDMVRIRQPGGTSTALPGLAPVAMQEGRHAASVISDRLRGRPVRRFRYRDKGNLATIGRASAVAEVKHVRVSGFLAWTTWLMVHLWYLIGFENRLLVVTRWAFNFVAHGRGARLITDGAARPIIGPPAPVTSLPTDPARGDARRERAACTTPVNDWRRDAVMKELISTIDIDASPDTVWQVLTDFGSYAEWNPVEISMKGRAAEGTGLEHTAQLPGKKPMTFRPTIVTAKPNEELA